MTPDSIMVYAAGFGTRLGNLVADVPKPMIEVGGRPLIDHALDLVRNAGVGTCVVNVHYKADVLKEHLSSTWESATVSHECPDILDTGGGLKHVLPILGPEPVFTLNADAVWRGANPLSQLAASWNSEMMDALLLLVPQVKAHGHAGTGDFQFTKERRIRRCAPGEHGHIYSGTQIIKTDELPEMTDRTFSLNVLWDRIAKRNRLFGLLYSGDWADAGTPFGLKVSERVLAGTWNPRCGLPSS